MEDKRVVKSKKKIKQALVTLLGEKAFDQITVTELCAAAQMSRITFYTHYADKYALAEDMFQDLLKVVEADFYRLQSENNPTGEALQGYCNSLDCILNLFESNTAFLRQMSQRRNPYLYYSFYTYVFHTVKQRVESESKKLQPRAGSQKFTAFICNGLWAYIDECYHEDPDVKKIRAETQALLKGMVQSELFVSNEQP